MAGLRAWIAALRGRGLAGWRHGDAPSPAPVPVIAVEGADGGGAGRVQALLAVALHLQEIGRRPAILWGCGGGRLEGPLAVDPQKHTAADVGDAPLLAAALAPVWISGERQRQRQRGVAAILAGGAPVDCILCVGFSGDCALFSDLSVVLRGAGRRVAAGGREAANRALPMGGRLEPLSTCMTWQGARLLAFAGAGQAEAFLAALRALGADLVGAAVLEDHQPLGAALMLRLVREAAASGAQLVTTELDATRLAPEFRHKVLILPLRLRVDDWTAFDAALAQLAPARG